MPVAANPARPEPTIARLTVARKEQLCDSVMRIIFTVDQFDYPGFADSYLKILFDEHGPLQHVPDHRPTLRTYTVRHYDADAHEVTVDFLVHGSEGLAGPWAVRCVPGEWVLARGPRGKWSPPADADFHLFVGDESAMPAIGAGLEQLDERARALVIIETEHGTHQLDAPAGVEVRWAPRDGEPYDEQRLANLVAALPWSTYGDISVFAHGERGAMKALRSVFKERNVPANRLSISGYWAFGRIEDEFQAEKKTAIGKI
ncbi:siderophore-interacting protein [uncultured Tessaracoccus sp.]|uniref:siderophore-interacting protein n=1 Tax=uncultured Tessaracoccus sp. TaxID=905023 RepID=UPI00261636FE|nr:siderophore-interacting protein [uncultured Tessaracoccus sp.]